MRVSDFLEQHEMSGADMARILDVTPGTVNGRRRRDEEIPDHWWEPLEAAGYGPGAYVPPADENQYREADQAPRPDPDQRLTYPTPKIDFSTLAGHISGIYATAGTYVIPYADPDLGACVVEYSDAAGEAWAKWVQANPQVAAWIERLMIGTPMGEVIGVHFGIFFAYILARQATAAVARGGDTSGQEPVEADLDGAPVTPAEDLMA